MILSLAFAGCSLGDGLRCAWIDDQVQGYETTDELGFRASQNCQDAAQTIGVAQVVAAPTMAGR